MGRNSPLEAATDQRDLTYRNAAGGLARACSSIMEERPQTLRRQIATYRRMLGGGANAEMAAVYLRQIAEAEAEITEIEGGAEDTAAVRIGPFIGSGLTGAQGIPAHALLGDYKPVAQTPLTDVERCAHYSNLAAQFRQWAQSEPNEEARAGLVDMARQYERLVVELSARMDAILAKSP